MALVITLAACGESHPFRCLFLFECDDGNPFLTHWGVGTKFPNFDVELDADGHASREVVYGVRRRGSPLQEYEGADMYAAFYMPSDSDGGRPPIRYQGFVRPFLDDGGYPADLYPYLNDAGLARLWDRNPIAYQNGGYPWSFTSLRMCAGLEVCERSIILDWTLLPPLPTARYVLSVDVGMYYQIYDYDKVSETEVYIRLKDPEDGGM
jgi:hypothetical protein